MSYLEEFRDNLEAQNYPRLLQLWEEYCLADSVHAQELLEILRLIKDSSFVKTFGKYAETVLSLWERIEEPEVAADVLRIVLDVQTSNSPILANLAIDFLEKHYSDHKHFNEKLRIVGLRGKLSFQGAISNYELLTHMNKGRFVFHTGGWGVGEVMEISLLREHVLIEFEGIPTPRDLSFQNAFRTLVPLSSEHILSRRFGDPDALEQEGKDDPLALIRMLLRDLGPKNAAEIKEELCELVIPEEDWAKWWQAARSKIKKDTKIKTPTGSKQPFELRAEEVSHESRFLAALGEVKHTEGLIQTIYHFVRDFPEVLKSDALKDQLKTRLHAVLEESEGAQKLQVALLLDEIFPDETSDLTTQMIKELEQIDSVLGQIDILAFKKRVLTQIRQLRDDWNVVFLNLLFLIPHNSLRDYIFRELKADEASSQLLHDKIKELLHKMTVYPDAFFWYFQKMQQESDIPLADDENQRAFLEALLILVHFIENTPEERDLVKKIHQTLLAGRYKIVRRIIEGASIAYLKEFLLLASKCHTLTQHDRQIFHSLATVVQPSLAEGEKEVELVLWTTQEGYAKLQERIHHIGSVETVDNAREIEAARAHGDLRENAEYKFALERRSQLQAELKTLSSQINQARILTKDDISTSEVGVGSVVKVADSTGKQKTYTLLGPWDADPDNHILSFQSKLAQAMIGCKKGESFEFQGEKFVVEEIASYL